MAPDTAAFSKWWGRHARSLRVNDPRRTFHSFRHGFADALRRAGVEEDVRDAFVRAFVVAKGGQEDTL